MDRKVPPCLLTIEWSPVQGMADDLVDSWNQTGREPRGLEQWPQSESTTAPNSVQLGSLIRSRAPSELRTAVQSRSQLHVEFSSHIDKHQLTCHSVIAERTDHSLQTLTTAFVPCLVADSFR